MEKKKVVDTFKTEVKNNKYTLIVIGVFLLLVLIGFALYKLLVPDSSSDVKYGNRLDGIEKVEPTKKELKTLDKKLLEIDFVKKSSTSISGRIIKIVVLVSDGTTGDKAKELSNKILESFSKEQIEYFDYEVFYTNENKDAQGFPIIGYKNKSNETFSYSSAK